MDADTIGQIGELALIERIRDLLPAGKPGLTGAGDDCAVIPGTAEDLVLTSDPVIEGEHFLAGTSGQSLGHKAVGRVLSDVAAMGGEPRWLLVDLVAPADTPVVLIDQIYAGMTALAQQYGASIVGGDIARGPVLELHIFGVGSVPSGRAILRSGGSPGDGLYVTGALGGSLAGRHLSFTPRVSEGRWLREWATAMMDVSDGLASDLKRLCAMSEVGCEMAAPLIPVSDAAAQPAGPRKPYEHALYDGEDFELVFSVSPSREAEFQERWAQTFDLACTRIGTLTPKASGILLVDAEGLRLPLTGSGYEHFLRLKIED